MALDPQKFKTLFLYICLEKQPEIAKNKTKQNDTRLSHKNRAQSSQKLIERVIRKDTMTMSEK